MRGSSCLVGLKCVKLANLYNCASSTKQIDVKTACSLGMHEKVKYFVFYFFNHCTCIALLYFMIVFAYSCPDRYMVRLRFASEKSTWNNPNRTLNPSAHSKLSSSDHAKYPRTLTPSSSIAVQKHRI